ncbi:IS3 family transposase, partial [Mammaliicoccus sciuri]
KQYSYGKGIEELSTVESLKFQLKRKEVENEILKKYKELERKCVYFL